jgi:bacterioferritin-associated ferredoxin
MIDRCICNEVSFERALETAEKHGCQTVSELQKRIDICDSCRMCLPYLQKVLETGQTEFET